MQFLVPLVVLCVTAVSGKFDCRHKATEMCKNGAQCNMDSGKCDNCSDDYEGYDCSVVKVNKNHPACSTNPCKHDGICHVEVGDSPICLCGEKYKGLTCEEKRYDLTCIGAGDGGMEMRVTPMMAGFSGLVYVQSKYDEPSCHFKGDPPSMGFLSNKDGTCGSTTDEDNSRMRYVVVQYHPELVTYLDELVTFVCGERPTIIQQLDLFTVDSDTSDFKAIESNQAPLDEDIDMKLEARQVEVDGSIDVGTEVEVTVQLTDPGNSKFEDIRLEHCFVSNKPNKDDVGYEFLNFIQDSCIHDDLRPVMTNDITKTGEVISFIFRAFKFNEVAQVYVTCEAKTCIDAADCQPVSCDGGSTQTGYGRKKRESTLGTILQRAIIINEPSVAASTGLQEVTGTQACNGDWKMTAAVVALAVGVLLLLVACVVMAVKLSTMATRTKLVYRDDFSETASTVSPFSHLPTIVSNKI